MQIVDSKDLELICDELTEANQMISKINEKINQIRKDTNYEVRLSAQKIQIKDCVEERDKARRLKENWEDTFQKMKDSSGEDLNLSKTFSLNVLNNEQPGNKTTYAWDGNWEFLNQREDSSNTYPENSDVKNGSLENQAPDLNGMNKDEFYKIVDSRTDLDDDTKNYLKEQFEKGNKRACSLQFIIVELKEEQKASETKLNNLKEEVQNLKNKNSYTIHFVQNDTNQRIIARYNSDLEEMKTQREIALNQGRDTDAQWFQGEIEKIEQQILEVERENEEHQIVLNLVSKKENEIAKQEEYILLLKKQIFQYEQERTKWEFDYLEGINYSENLNLEEIILNIGLFEFSDYANWNTISISQYEYQNIENNATKADFDYLLILTYMYHSKEYKSWFLETYPNLEFTKENIVNIFGISDIMNNERSLQARSFLMMSEDQINKYIYLYNKEGSQKAKTFLEAFEEDVNNALGFQMAMDGVDQIEDVDSFFRKLCKTLNIGIGDGVVGCINNIMTSLNRNTTMTPTEYKAQYLCQIFLMASKYLKVDSNTLLQMKKNGQISEEVYNTLSSKKNITQLDIDLENGVITEDIYQQFQEKLKDEKLRNLIEKMDNNGIYFNYTYQIGSNIGNMLPSQIAGILTGGAGFASNLILFLGAYGGAYKQTQRSGNKEWASNIYALLSAGSEVVTEYFLGRISGLGKGKNLSNIGEDILHFSSRWQIFTNMLKTTASDILEEIKEEELQNVLDAVFKTIVLGEPLELSGQEVIDTAIITFFTTGLMNARTNISNFTTQNINYSMNHFINSNGTIDLSKLNNYLSSIKLNNEKIVDLLHLDIGLTAKLSLIKKITTDEARISALKITNDIIIAKSLIKALSSNRLKIEGISLLSNLSKKYDVGTVDFYIDNINFLQEVGLSFENYLNGLNIGVSHFKKDMDLAFNIGDSKLYLFKIMLHNYLEPNSIKEERYYNLAEQTKICSKYFSKMTGDVDVNEMFREFSPYLSQEQIKNYQLLHDNGISERYANSFSKQQKDAVYNYTQLGGFEINGWLNNTSFFDEKGKKVLFRSHYQSIGEIQNEISGLTNNKRKNRIFTTMDGDIIQELDSVIRDAKYDKAIVTYRGITELYDYNTKINPEDLQTGMSFGSAGYQSSSLLLQNCYGNKDDTNIILEIIVPPEKGIGIYIENISGTCSYQQSEFLIKRDAKYTVIDDVRKQIVNGVEKVIIPVVVQ